MENLREMSYEELAKFAEKINDKLIVANKKLDERHAAYEELRKENETLKSKDKKWIDVNTKVTAEKKMLQDSLKQAEEEIAKLQEDNNAKRLTIKGFIAKDDQNEAKYEKLVQEDSQLSNFFDKQVEENQELRDYIYRLEGTIDTLTRREEIRPDCLNTPQVVRWQVK